MELTLENAGQYGFLFVPLSDCNLFTFLLSDSLSKYCSVGVAMASWLMYCTVASGRVKSFAIFQAVLYFKCFSISLFTRLALWRWQLIVHCLQNLVHHNVQVLGFDYSSISNKALFHNRRFLWSWDVFEACHRFTFLETSEPFLCHKFDNSWYLPH